MRVVTVVGARPQFIKLAPVNHALREVGLESVIVHTGQHYDPGMSQVFFNELGIPAPTHHLGVGSGTHGAQTAEMLRRVEEVLLQEKPESVLVFGDTNSTLAGALAAAKLHIPVAHVEAGLRSFDRRMPEELNRILTDVVSSLLFCPTPTAVKNLEREGVTNGVHEVGDVMRDVLCTSIERARRESGVLNLLGLTPGRYLLATVHRAENTDNHDRLDSILEALTSTGLPTVLPLHPRTRARIESSPKWKTRIKRTPSLSILDPVGHLDLLRLADAARAVLTDSGGLQKEAFWLGVPCLILRDQTEWLETLLPGRNLLVGADHDRILQALKELPINKGGTPHAQSENTSAKIARILAATR